MGQKGFATLEVILMVMVIGILASIAVPRFANIGAKANTAKIQADLSTIDTAIAVYELEKGAFGSTTPTLEALKPYLQDATSIKPPTGKAYANGNEIAISATSYGFVKKDEGWRATYDGKTAGEFTASSSSGNGNSGSGTSETPTTGT